MNLTYPSALFPPPPGVAVQVPDNWQPVTLPGTALAARQEVADGRFAPNITVTLTRHTKGYGVDAALDEVRRVAAEQPEGASQDEFTTEFGGTSFRGCNVAFRHAEAGPLVQIHLFAELLSEGVADIVHLTGTCGADRLPEDYELLHDVLQTVTVSARAA